MSQISCHRILAKSLVFSLVFSPPGEIVIAKCEAVTAEYKRANYAHAHNKGVKK